MGADRAFEVDESSETVYCARHPQVETYLRCGRCNTPICPRCLVQTPVGARCRDCANVRVLPTFDITPVYFARGMTAALVSGLVVGFIWAVISGAFGGFFTLLIGLGVGWAISESIGLAANRRRGLGLQICAVFGVALAYLVHEAVAPGFGIRGFDLVAAVFGAFYAVMALKAR